MGVGVGVGSTVGVGSVGAGTVGVGVGSTVGTVGVGSTVGVGVGVGVSSTLGDGGGVGSCAVTAAVTCRATCRAADRATTGPASSMAPATSEVTIKPLVIGVDPSSSTPVARSEAFSTGVTRWTSAGVISSRKVRSATRVISASVAAGFVSITLWATLSARVAAASTASVTGTSIDCRSEVCTSLLSPVGRDDSRASISARTTTTLACRAYRRDTSSTCADTGTVAAGAGAVGAAVGCGATGGAVG